MSPCCNVHLTKNENGVLFKNVILELMQSISALDEKLISECVKPFKFPPKAFTFAKRLPPPNFLKFRSSGPHCYSILLFMLICLTKLNFLWLGEAIAS